MVTMVNRKSSPSIIGFEFAEDPDLDIEDVTREDILSAYRVLLPTHGLYYGVCKRNCRNNPRCLTGLGEKVWFEEDTVDEDEEEFSFEAELMRSDGIPSGLKNLGNTCYVNSFLQIWFHNSIFRQALYEWDPGEDPEEQDNESILDPELYEPASKVASLQALFALMQYTKRKYVDPTEFICKLGLNPSVQQDAQEFSKLFVSLLETSLEHQTNQNIRGMIQKLFRGEYAYVTTCLTCKRESVRPSYFYELDLALVGGTKNLTIEKCLEDFLRIETMTGDEKYFCEGCQSKQEATRCCQLRNLPMVLNLQLNRFQYDMQFGRKKKLNSSIMFPSVLDMSKYCDREGGGGIYYLIGVLMHVGPDANHGHYIAHIQELETGNWYKFSDEHVASMDTKVKPRPASIKRLKALQESQMNKNQTSNNAYMLVYMRDKTIQEIRERDSVELVKREKVRRQAMSKGPSSSMMDHQRGTKRKLSSEDGVEVEEISTISQNSTNSDAAAADYVFSNCRIFPTSLQPHLRNRIDKDNLEFDEEIEEKRQRRFQIARHKHLKKMKMKETYKNLLWICEESEMPDEDSFEFIPKSWLMDWFSDPSAVGSIDTSMFLCIHGSLDIDRLSEVKLCSKEGVKMLVSEYGFADGPRLNSTRLCWTCVANKARLLSLDYKLARDQDFIRHQMRIPTDGKGFWIGKKSLSQWKRLAREALEDSIVRESREANLAGINDYWAEKSSCSKPLRKVNSPEIITIDDDDDDEEEEDDLHSDEDDIHEGVVVEEDEDIEIDEVKLESDTSQSKSDLNLSCLQTKLGKMGTNVSLRSPPVANSSPLGMRNFNSVKEEPSPGMSSSTDPSASPFQKLSASALALNTDHPSKGGKTAAGGGTVVKPSCAVKPTMKPAKPSATVRPLNIAECLQAEAENLIKDDASSSTSTKDDDEVADLYSPLSVTPPVTAAASATASPISAASNLIVNNVISSNSAQQQQLPSTPPPPRLNGQPTTPQQQHHHQSSPRITLPSSNSNVGVTSSPPKKLPVKSSPLDNQTCSKGTPPYTGDDGTLSGVTKQEPSSIVTNGVGSIGASDVKPNMCRVAPNVNSNNASVLSSPSCSKIFPPQQQQQAAASSNNVLNGGEGNTAAVNKNSTASSSPSSSLNHNHHHPTSCSNSSSNVKSRSNSSSQNNDVKQLDIGSPNPINANGVENGAAAASGSKLQQQPVHLPESEDAFNADIVCVHGNLRVEERCKQLISREVWFTLCTYFKNPTTFQFGVKPCGQCKEEASKEFLLREKCKEEATRQKARLADLFAGIDRPKWSKPATRRVYLISSEFVHAWRAYCKGISSGKALPGESISDVNNGILLCPHGGLFHSPSLNWENYPDPSCVMLREEEWPIVKELFQVDFEIMVEKDTSSPCEPQLVSSPPVCHKCLKTKAEAEHESRLNYKNQTLFVTYLTQDEEIPPCEEFNDPEFCSNHEMRGGGNFGMRRSTRRKRGRGEKQFVVSSDTLLRDLKVQIMEVFKVAPFDQILCLNGEYLNDNTQSLASLGVLPGSSIFLKADQSVPCEPEDWGNPHPEQGFKGTGLLSA